MRAREDDARLAAEQKAADEREALGRTHALKAVQNESDAVAINISELEEQDDDEDVAAEIVVLKSKKADLEKKEEQIQEQINQEVNNHFDMSCFIIL